jgi:hypothetical protein
MLEPIKLMLMITKGLNLFNSFSPIQMLKLFFYEKIPVAFFDADSIDVAKYPIVIF